MLFLGKPLFLLLIHLEFIHPTHTWGAGCRDEPVRHVPDLRWCPSLFAPLLPLQDIAITDSKAGVSFGFRLLSLKKRTSQEWP